jgi:hypothetical protein
VNDASAALARVKDQLLSDLASGVDPKLWLETHPWATIAGAMVAGFAAASLLVPSKEQQALRRLAAIERALMPKPADMKSPVDGDGVKGREKPTFLSGLATEILGAVKPALLSMLTAGVTAKATKPTEEEMHNAAYGDTPPTESPKVDDPASGI